LCTALSLVLLTGILFVSCFGSPLIRYQLERQVQTYLEAQGYQEEDWTRLRTVYNRQEQNKYLVEVEFTAMPEQVYYYVHDPEHGVQQLEKIGK